MPLIDREIVKLDDRVVDIALGEGTVIAITPNDITVKLDNGARVVYDKEGKYGGVKRLYWHYPVVINPPRDSAKWQTLSDCIHEVAKYLIR